LRRLETANRPPTTAPSGTSPSPSHSNITTAATVQRQRAAPTTTRYRVAHRPRPIFIAWQPHRTARASSVADTPHRLEQALPQPRPRAELRGHGQQELRSLLDALEQHLLGCCRHRVHKQCNRAARGTRVTRHTAARQEQRQDGTPALASSSPAPSAVGDATGSSPFRSTSPPSVRSPPACSSITASNVRDAHDGAGGASATASTRRTTT
jgi:hypothetical protein